MALYLTENDIESLITMPEAIESLEVAFQRQANGEVINQPRRRLFMPKGTFHHGMAAADPGLGVYCTKIYSSYPPKTRFLVLLYSSENGDLLAMIEGDRLGQIRTGAATGLATSYLARSGSDLFVGIYGTGWQAQTQLEAVAAACSVAKITAYGRDADRRGAFCTRMSSQLNITVAPAESPIEAAAGQDVVITATGSKSPVFDGAWLKPGAHVNAVGSNLLMKREIDDLTITRSKNIVVDSIEQSKLESGDLLPAFEKRLFRWEQVIELSEIVSGKRAGRISDEDITLFKSNGIALEDLAVAHLVYQKAIAGGVGREVEMWR